MDQTGGRRPDRESVNLPCILLVDRQPVVQYTDQHIQNQGNTRPQDGPATTVAFKYPAFGYPELHLQFVWCTDEDEAPFAHVTVSCCPQFVESVPVCVTPTVSGFQQFSRLRRLPLPDFDPKTAVLGLFVQPEGIEAYVTDQKVAELRLRFGHAAVQCFQDLRRTLAHLDEQAKFEFIFTNVNPLPLTEAKNFLTSFTGGRENPLEPLAARAMTSWKFTRGNMLLPSEAGFNGHDPAKMRFDDMQERSAKLAYATYYEQLYDEATRGTLETKLFQSYAIGVESTKIQGHFTEYLIMPQVKSADDMNMMPRTGKEEFDVEVLVGCNVPQLPKKAYSEEQIVETVTNYLIQKLRDAMSRLGHNRADPKLLRARMMRWISTVYPKSVDGSREKVIDLVKHAATQMAKHYRDPKDETDEGESWDEWRAKVKSYVAAHVQHLQLPPIEIDGNIVLRGARLGVPKGMSGLGRVIIAARVPRVRNWAREAGEAPFYRPCIPTAKVGATLATTAQMISNREAKKSAEGQVTADKNTFRIRIIRNASDTTMKMELDSISRTTVPDDDTSNLGYLSRFLVAFRGDVLYHRVTKIFPILRDVVAAHELHKALTELPSDFNGWEYNVTNPKHSIFLNALTELPHDFHGWGDKKKQADHAGDAAASEATPTRDDILFALRLMFARLDKDQKGLFGDLASLAFGLLNVFGVPGAGKTRVMVMIVLMTCIDMVNQDTIKHHIDQMAGAETYSGPGSSDAGDASGDASGDTSAAPDQADQPSEPNLARSKAFVQVASNIQGDDMCEHFGELIRKLNLSIRVLRLNMIERELRNATSKGYDRDELVYDPLTEMEAAVESEMEISQLLGQYKLDKQQRSTLHGGVYSVSEVASAMVDQVDKGSAAPLDDEYQRLVNNIAYFRETRKRDPRSFFARDLPAYRLAWRQLIFKIISDADIIVGTPTAAKKIADNPEIDFEPLVVWSDEAGRASEAAGLASFAFFPNAVLRSLSGDDKQPSNMTFSGAGLFKRKGSECHFINQFVKQLETSILKRMGDGRCPSSQLRITHRMHGELELFPSNKFYDGKMTSANVGLNDEIDRIRQFLRIYGPRCQISVLMVDIKEAAEEKDGTSYINRSNVGFVVRAVVNLFKQEICFKNPTATTPGERTKVIIISPYDSQRRLYNEELDKLSDAEIVRGLVEVRTIPAAQGCQAPFIFFDSTRTDGLGFLREHKNLNVCLTRAQFGMMVVGKLSCWSGVSAGPFNGLKQFYFDAGAVQTYKESQFAVDCRRCHQDHATNTCKWNVECLMCPDRPGHHHTRDCKKEPIKMSPTLPAGHTLVDIGDAEWAKREFTQAKKSERGMTFQELMGVEPEKKPGDKGQQDGEEI